MECLIASSLRAFKVRISPHLSPTPLPPPFEVEYISIYVENRKTLAEKNQDIMRHSCNSDMTSLPSGADHCLVAIKGPLMKRDTENKILSIDTAAALSKI